MTTAIFNLSTKTSQVLSKTHVSYAQISPSYLDPSQPPTKRTPFRQIRNIPFVHDVRVCMPTRFHQRLYSDYNDVSSDASAEHRIHKEVTYSKVILSLKDILADYDLRTGNYILISQPYPPTSLSPSLQSANSTTITVNCGNLSISMPQHIYQRTGLPLATKVPSGGRKHQSSSMRHIVDIDLRSPSMVRGRKGFDRLVWAATNVDGLREARVWLIAKTNEPQVSEQKGKKRKLQHGDQGEQLSESVDTETTISTTQTHEAENASPDPLSRHHPTIVSDHGALTTQHSVLIPHIVSDSSILDSLASTPTSDKSVSYNSLPTILDEDIHDLTGYLALLFLQSPILTQQAYGKTDPNICRYTLPLFQRSSSSAPEEEEADTQSAEVGAEDISYVTWPAGLISSDFVTGLVVDLLRRSRTVQGDGDGGDPDLQKGMWAAIQVNAHRTNATGCTDGYVILLQGSSSEDLVTETVATGGMGEQNEGERSSSPSKMDADHGSKNEAATKEAESQLGSGVGRGFRYATCFEFEDSVVH